VLELAIAFVGKESRAQTTAEQCSVAIGMARAGAELTSPFAHRRTRRPRSQLTPPLAQSNDAGL
jgi:hypothetical protein